MAHSPARTGTVSVQLRRVLSRAAAHSATRRLLVVAGLALAGWLLGSTAHASASTDMRSTAHASASTDADTGQAVATVVSKGEKHEMRQPRVQGASPRELIVAGRPGNLVKKVREALTARPGDDGGGGLRVRTPDLRGLSGKVRQIVSGGPSTGASVGGGSWASRHRTDAVATSGVPRSPLAGARWAADRTADTYQAPGAGSQRPDASKPGLPKSHVLLPTGGAAGATGAAGGAFGGLLEAGGPLPGRSRGTALVPALGNVSPAIRTAADEPSFAPD